MTKQEIFNKVAKHLLRQSKRSVNEGGQCMYRGPNNTRCAVGCLIPKSAYQPAMEGRLAANLLISFPAVVRCGLVPANMSLVQALQDIHDEVEPENWRRELMALAKRRKLDPKVLEHGRPWKGVDNLLRSR